MEEKEPIVSFKDAHEIGKHFYDIQQQFTQTPIPESNYKGVYLIQASTAVDYYSQVFSGDIERQYYVRFGRFLDFLVEKIIPNINYDLNIKLIKIDTNVKSNIIHVLPKIVSADPRVCSISTAFKINEKIYNYAPLCSEFIIPFNDSAIKGTYGYVMNIYFNFDFILNKINELKDDKGKISLYSLLDALCKGFNEATGHYNKLEPIIDAEENIIKILDDVALPDRKAILKSSLLSGSFGNELTENVVFDTYGYYTGTVDNIYGSGVPHAGFIKDLSFTTTVSPELATMITVGSTNQGYVKGQDATALSRMNNGLTDRFKSEITNTNQVPGEEQPPLEVEYKVAIEAFNLYIQRLGVSGPDEESTYDEKAVDNYKNTQTQFVEYQQASATLKEKKEHPESTAASPNSGFLPFDLSLTMDGLSGMKVYQNFLMDTSFLPTNYPGTLEFLIKGIIHKIEGNQWTTNIESMAIPKNPFAISGSDTYNPVDEASRNTNRGTSNTTITYYQSNLPPDQAKNRATLTRILDDGTQTLGILEIWDVNHVNIIYRLATVELPWKNNENGNSCIPTGNYLVNSRQTAKRGQHFWLVGSEAGQWKRIPGANASDRSLVLIHPAPKAPDWLAGCIGPGPQFDFKRKNSKGNPDGVGTKYLYPAIDESTAALNKLISTLYNDKGFKMEIKNGWGVSSTDLPKSINDSKIKTLAADARYKDLFKGI
jgi:hypothetical protein